MTPSPISVDWYEGLIDVDLSEVPNTFAWKIASTFCPHITVIFYIPHKNSGSKSQNLSTFPCVCPPMMLALSLHRTNLHLGIDTGGVINTINSDVKESAFNGKCELDDEHIYDDPNLLMDFGDSKIPAPLAAAAAAATATATAAAVSYNTLNHGNSKTIPSPYDYAVPPSLDTKPAPQAKSAAATPYANSSVSNSGERKPPYANFTASNSGGRKPPYANFTASKLAAGSATDESDDSRYQAAPISLSSSSLGKPVATPRPTPSPTPPGYSVPKPVIPNRAAPKPPGSSVPQPQTAKKIEVPEKVDLAEDILEGKETVGYFPLMRKGRTEESSAYQALLNVKTGASTGNQSQQEATASHAQQEVPGLEEEEEYTVMNSPQVKTPEFSD